jgi:hypothetical protein
MAMTNERDRTDKAPKGPTPKHTDAQAEISKEELDASLDHGIKETFPGSDPVSVNVSKYAPGDEGPPSDQGMPKGVPERARDSAASLAGKASEAMADVSERAREFVPQVARQVGKGSNFLRDRMYAYPGPALILAGVIGLGVGLIAYEAMSTAKPRRNRMQSGSMKGRAMADTGQIREHMEVIGADGVHVGTVDSIEGDRIKLTKRDSGEGSHKGHHHFIATSLIAGIEGDKVRLSANSDVAVTFEEEENPRA